jgi:amino acid adenylation domain-containing protein
VNKNLKQAWRLEREFLNRSKDWKDWPAIEDTGRIWTYEDLSTISNQLAHRLIDQGVKPGDIVALATRDIASFVIGALAIVKIGAVYLSVDTRYDRNRARHVLFEKAAGLLLISGELGQDCIPAGLPVLQDAFDPSVLKSFPSQTPVIESATDTPAYICYTSGSTGRPKGVVVGHAGIAGLVDDPNFAPIVPRNRVAQTTTYAFDGSTIEIWGALLNGACLVAVQKDTLLSPAKLAEFIRIQRIDVMWLTTSHFNAIATRFPAAFSRLTTLMIGGEAADSDVLAAFFEAGCPPVRVINGYGPTEATSLITWHEIQAKDAIAKVIPIGKPLLGRTVSIRNAALAQVPVGEAGELCVAGDAVASGYLNAPNLTAEKFVTLDECEPMTIYRTGDLCREREDGSFEYIGRMDEQVKIRGFRVELSGVASALGKLTGVAEANVLARKTLHGSNELIGFVRGSNLRSGNELRRELEADLPDFMLPARIVIVDQFPLKPTGKLDRESLLELGRRKTATHLSADELGDLECKLMQVWAKHADGHPVSLDTSLSEIGVDSLQLIDIALSIESCTGFIAQPGDLNERTNIQGLSDYIRKVTDSNNTDDACARSFFIGHPWSVLKLSDNVGFALSEGKPWDQLQIDPRVFDKCTSVTVDNLARTLVSKLKSLSPTGPYVLAGHSFSGLIALEMVRILEQGGDKVRLLVLIDVYFGQISTNTRWLPLVRTFVRNSIGKRLGRFQKKPDNFVIQSRSQSIRRICTKAMATYQPAPWSGRTLLIRCNAPDLIGFIGWDPVLENKIERVVEGTHASIIEELRELDDVADLIRTTLA